MRIPYLGLFVILLVNLSVDWYIFRYLLTEFRRSVWPKIQLCTAALFALGIIYLFFAPVKTTSESMMQCLMWGIFVYISIYLPKYIFVIFDCISRLPQLWHRRRIPAVTWTGGIIGVIVFLAMWWGALFNRFNLDVEEVDVSIPGLPAAFDGMRIVQISDLHVGTYGENTAFVDKLVERVNSLHPDLIFFTGDIVNRKTTELEPFVGSLAQLKAKYGVYSILGNHDYGDYYNWADSADRLANNERLAQLQADMGWTLLRNDSKTLTVNGDSIVIIGVENIGDPPFHNYGDLSKAYATPKDGLTKIMLSHNPAHWVRHVADSDFNIALTLSGHTHAMQVSLFGWSPASFRYKTWGGLYSDDSKRHQLYVNIGSGTVGFPARVGATPEITLITIEPASNETKKDI